MAKDDEEGFVVRFASRLRIKVKFDEYVRLHRLITGVYARRIWELLASGGSIDELIQRVPEEFESWVKQTAVDIWARFGKVVDEAEKDYFFQCKEGSEDRKSFALAATKTIYPAIMFAMYDKKPYASMIWKMIKPAAERPFIPSDE